MKEGVDMNRSESFLLGKNRRHPLGMKACYAVLFLTLLSVGCATPATYHEPITRFQQASTVVIEVARTQYMSANNLERDAMIDGCVVQRKEIKVSDLNNAELTVLGPDQLAVRMAALDALAKHCQLLLTLASSDAPAKAKDAANSLQAAIVGLNTALTHEPDVDFKNIAGGFTAIAGEAAQLALEAQIRKSLDKAIMASEKDVKALMAKLRDEMGDLYERQRGRLSAARGAATEEYNKELKDGASVEKLEKAALKIKKAEDAWDRLPQTLGAGPCLDAMAQAHQKLVDYARSPKKPQDLAGLVDAMDSFVTRAKTVADAIKTIREGKE
jgi:hypothetical protein